MQEKIFIFAIFHSGKKYEMLFENCKHDESQCHYTVYQYDRKIIRTIDNNIRLTLYPDKQQIDGISGYKPNCRTDNYIT